ncbi:hypothetical protein Q5P01_014799 [Channa striata]|uniref:Uncharacterized protein n=1 Tax=Channa striata TaxID=64152 RepID=A0AA88MJA3_CHASR|nr:hypothetical protein Q5P01_014799 [Channa striata]
MWPFQESRSQRNEDRTTIQPSISVTPHATLVDIGTVLTEVLVFAECRKLKMWNSLKMPLHTFATDCCMTQMPLEEGTSPIANCTYF